MISYVRVCFVLVWPYFHMFACTYMCFNGLNFILSYWLTIECLSSIQTSKNTFILLFTEKYYELSLASNCYRTQKNLCVGNIRMFCMSLYVCVCVCVCANITHARAPQAPWQIQNRPRRAIISQGHQSYNSKKSPESYVSRSNSLDHVCLCIFAPESSVTNSKQAP